jgi:hypothetical protein
MLDKRFFVASILLCAATIPIDADAFARRTFVSSTGDDGNVCNVTGPCRSFATAIAQTNIGGEVVVLDSAGYGSVIITQSVSLIAPPGVYAGISVFAPDAGVFVNAGASDKVVLRGLSISGQGGMHGIVVGSAAEVSIENCVVSHMTGTGIFVYPALVSPSIQIRNTSVRSNGEMGLWMVAGTPTVLVVDSEFVLNGYTPLLGGPKPGININGGTLNAQRIVVASNAQFGIAAAPDVGLTVVATISDSTIVGNNAGVLVASPLADGGTASLTLVRSTVATNAGDGLWADGPSAVMAISLAVSDSVVTENGGAGVNANGATTTVLVTRSTVARNAGPDFSNTGGVFRSSSNNTLTGRGAADIQGAITSNPPQ